jgi:hypothetical protein
MIGSCTNAGTGAWTVCCCLSMRTKLNILTSVLDNGDSFVSVAGPPRLLFFCIENTLESLVTKAEKVIRRISGRKIGSDAHTILIPACTVVQISVFEYDGTRLPDRNPRTTLTSPVTIVLYTTLALGK